MSAVHLTAPFAGWATSLDDVPDPVFSGRLMGAGLAIDPLEGVVRAPCAATVISIAPTRHSVTLRLGNGAELLIHIGLETVALEGHGFVAQASDGWTVREGEPLIRFDLDAVARRAKSLITPIVIVNDGFRIVGQAAGRITAGGSLMTVMQEERAETAASGEDDRLDCEVTVTLANGVHARPAAQIAAALKGLDADLRLGAHDRAANARSPVALMTLGLKLGDIARLTASGKDAPAALEAVAALIAAGPLDHAPSHDVGLAVSPPASATRAFKGVRAAPGFAVGPLVQFRAQALAVPEIGQGVAVETRALEQALADLQGGGTSAHSGVAAEIAQAQRALIEDPELRAGAQVLVATGASAAFAWQTAIREQADALRRTGDSLLVERVADLEDIEQQVIARLVGGDAPGDAPLWPDNAILIADELRPSQFMALDATRLGGIATARGGPTSHVAILAASAGIPMLVACGAGLLELAEGGPAILDANAGVLIGAPTSAELADANARRAEIVSQRSAHAAGAGDLCIMADGTRIEVFANLASVDEVAQAVAFGAEGCGLLRTEFLFLERTEPPSEDEQCDVYAAVARALAGRPLIVRTLDVGGDKPAPYMPFPSEANPALGKRGIRYSFERPDLLATQLRAILRGVPANQCRIMLPMIVDLPELRKVRQLLEAAASAVQCEARIPLGIMVETPSAALISDRLAAEADFLSIGSNDLTQYALAADRGNPAVAEMVDGLHPAVLRLIAETGRSAAKHARWLGVCGALASDPKAAAILIGLGVTELSVVPALVPAVKATVRTLKMEYCTRVAAQVLCAGSAAEVHAMLDGKAG